MTTEIQIATGSAIARAARLAWETDGKDGEPEIPTERDLAEWIDQIPRKYLEDADGKLLEMMAKVGEPIGGEHGIPMLLRQAIWTTSGGELLAELLYGGYREVVDGDTAPREAVDEELTAFLMWIDLLERGMAATFYLVDLLPILTRLAVEHVTYAWTPTDSPLVHLARAWQDRPVLVRPNRRPDQILPSRLAQVDLTDNRAGRLFGFAAHTKDGQLVLPGFSESVTPRSPALPLELYDLGLGPQQTPGRGAPLALRLFVSSVLAVPERQRREGARVVYRFTLRELMERLWPGKRLYPSQQWPGLMQAIELVDKTRIPWYDPETGHGGMRRVVGFDDVPRSPHHLEDLVSHRRQPSAWEPGRAARRSEPRAVGSHVGISLPPVHQSGLPHLRARADSYARARARAAILGDGGRPRPLQPPDPGRPGGLGLPHSPHGPIAGGA